MYTKVYTYIKRIQSTSQVGLDIDINRHCNYKTYTKIKPRNSKHNLPPPPKKKSVYKCTFPIF